MRLACAAAILCFALNARAQQFVVPAQPTTNDFIRYVVVFNSVCGWEKTAVVNGSQITITWVSNGLCFSVLDAVSTDIGYLPAGSYNVTVNIDNGGQTSTVTGSFTVAQGANTDVPTLDATAIALLLACLSIAGVIASRS
jgi:hypothetical protein